MEQNILTKVEQQRKNRKRYNIYIDDDYAFSVHEDILISFRLFKGYEITDNNIKTILHEEEKNKVRQKAISYLSYKARTELELKKHLLNKGFDKELIDLVVEKLKAENLINDHSYAQQYIEDRIKINPRGKKLLALELKNKGISNENYQIYLEKIDEEAEIEMATKLVEKKISIYRDLDWMNFQRKISGFLQRRGFSYSTINEILNKYKDYS